MHDAVAKKKTFQTKNRLVPLADTPVANLSQINGKYKSQQAMQFHQFSIFWPVTLRLVGGWV